MTSPKLKLMEKPIPQVIIDWEIREAFIPECLILSDALLEGEWFARQAEVDRNRRPVTPPTPPTPREQKAIQLEMFRKAHRIIFDSDMKFRSFKIKPTPDGDLSGEVVLSVDIATGEALDVFGPLLQMQGLDVDVFIGSTK